MKMLPAICMRVGSILSAGSRRFGVVDGVGNDRNDALLGEPGWDRLCGTNGEDVLLGDSKDAVLDGGPGTILVNSPVKVEAAATMFSYCRGRPPYPLVKATGHSSGSQANPLDRRSSESFTN